MLSVERLIGATTVRSLDDCHCRRRNSSPPQPAAGNTTGAATTDGAAYACSPIGEPRPEQERTITMVDELYDRGYQNGRAELHAGLDRLFASIGRGVTRTLATLHRIEWSAPWRDSNEGHHA